MRLYGFLGSQNLRVGETSRQLVAADLMCLYNMDMGVYVLHVTACFLYMCMGVIDCSIQVFGRIISCIDDVMRLDR